MSRRADCACVLLKALSPDRGESGSVEHWELLSIISGIKTNFFAKSCCQTQPPFCLRHEGLIRWVQHRGIRSGVGAGARHIQPGFQTLVDRPARLQRSLSSPKLPSKSRNARGVDRSQRAAKNQHRHQYMRICTPIHVCNRSSYPPPPKTSALWSITTQNRNKFLLQHGASSMKPHLYSPCGYTENYCCLLDIQLIYIA